MSPVPTSAGESPFFRASLLPVALLSLLVFLLKVPTLATPPYWDEMAWFGQAQWLSDHSLVTALPGLRPAAAFWGHPPGLHLTLAAIWKVAGRSTASAHGLIALFAALGVCFTYLLGRLLYDGKTGLLAAFFLLLAPIYFAQSGMFLADVPVAALGVMCVFFALRRRDPPYLLCASYMVLLKETAIALVVALVLYLVVLARRRPGFTWRGFARPLAIYAAPLFVIGAFILLQKITTGHFVTIYEFDFQLFHVGPRSLVRQTLAVSRWIFLEQNRFLFTGLILVDLALNPAARRRAELLLFGLILLLSGYSFAVLYFLPRYLLPVLPYFYLLGTVSLMDLVPGRLPRAAAAGSLLLIVLAAWRHPPFDGNAEFNLRYLDVVRANRAMCRIIEAKHSGARILTVWPQSTQLGRPALGYVSAPVPVILLADSAVAQRADLIFASVPWTGPRLALREYAHRNGWELIERAGRDSVSAELYARGADLRAGHP